MIAFALQMMMEDGAGSAPADTGACARYVQTFVQQQHPFTDTADEQWTDVAVKPFFDTQAKVCYILVSATLHSKREGEVYGKALGDPAKDTAVAGYRKSSKEDKASDCFVFESQCASREEFEALLKAYFDSHGGMEP